VGTVCDLWWALGTICDLWWALGTVCDLWWAMGTVGDVCTVCDLWWALGTNVISRNLKMGGIDKCLGGCKHAKSANLH